jgi:tRNA C32,U32 (ribose-2'-O)-methylase TrmJ
MGAFSPDGQGAADEAQPPRSLFLRTRMTQQEAQTMRGVIKALTIGRGGRKKMTRRK